MSQLLPFPSSKRTKLVLNCNALTDLSGITTLSQLEQKHFIYSRIVVFRAEETYRIGVQGLEILC